MIRKNLKKAFTKNYRFDGFTLTELVVGMLIVAIASLAIFTGVIGYLLGQRRPQKSNFPLPPLPTFDSGRELSDDEL